MGLSAHQKNGGHDEWLTPPEILLALGPFDLDPCAPIVRPWETADQPPRGPGMAIQDGGISLNGAAAVKVEYANNAATTKLTVGSA